MEAFSMTCASPRTFAPSLYRASTDVLIIIIQGIQNILFSTGEYSLTGRSGPLVTTLRNQMRECSQAIGVSQDILVSNKGAINNLAKNLSHYLTALYSIIPQNFSSSYRSPCWETPIHISNSQQNELTELKDKTTPMSTLTKHLYQTILKPALNQTNNRSMMCLPAFFLAGFPKSATTTLHSVLYKHDMISHPLSKEPHWWTRMPLRNGNHIYLILTFICYLVYYYTQANSEIKEYPQLLTYDASQSTLWDSNFQIDYEDYCTLPITISHILPSAKFIVLMRNPVTRTYSHQIYSSRLKNTTVPSSNKYHEMVLKSVNFFNSCLSNGTNIHDCFNKKYYSLHKAGAASWYLTVSMYYLHIQKWFQLFPRERFLFLRMEDMSIDPYTFMKNITNFLNIDNLSHLRIKSLFSRRRNVRTVKAEMLPETQAVLSEFFQPFNAKLVELTGDNRFFWNDL